MGQPWEGHRRIKTVSEGKMNSYDSVCYVQQCPLKIHVHLESPNILI